MAPHTPLTNKQPTDNWGDFHNGTAAGYYESEDPNGSLYCLLNGDLVGLIDIDQASVNNFIRQPTTAGNPLNIPGGTYFNTVDPANARFYPDQSLGNDPVNNPGMSTTGGTALNNPPYTPPCNIPARNEPTSQLTLGRFNLSNPMAGDPVAENATGYLLRWVQWMLDVHHVDGFRIDAIKHTLGWFFDTYFDSTVYNLGASPPTAATSSHTASAKVSRATTSRSTASFASPTAAPTAPAPSPATPSATATASTSTGPALTVRNLISAGGYQELEQRHRLPPRQRR